MAELPKRAAEREDYHLLTVTSYGGIDPEVDSNLTYGIAGNSKQYLFGLELTF